MNISFLNFYMSALRNMFLLSSIAIGLIGFSDRFGKLNGQIIKIFAIGVIILAIFMGKGATDVFQTLHLEHMNSEGITEVDKTILEQSSIFPIFAYVYTGVLVILVVTLLARMIKLWNKK